MVEEQTHPNLYPLVGDDRPLTLLKRGCANSVVGLGLADVAHAARHNPSTPRSTFQGSGVWQVRQLVRLKIHPLRCCFATPSAGIVQGHF